MPELILALEIDPSTGRKRLRVAYESDPGALPMEHEEEHRALVARLLEAGLVDSADQVVIEREVPKAAREAARKPAESGRTALEEG